MQLAKSTSVAYNARHRVGWYQYEQGISSTQENNLAEAGKTSRSKAGGGAEFCRVTWISPNRAQDLDLRLLSEPREAETNQEAVAVQDCRHRA